MPKTQKRRQNKTLSPARTASRKARRRQLIEATIESIAKNGLSGTTLTTVTKEADLSHGIVNFHFKSKEVLFEETLGYLAQEHYDHWLSAMTNAGPDPVKQLAAIISVDFKSNICSPKKLAVWFAFWGQAKYRPTYLNIHSAHDEQRLVELTRLCSEIVADGAYSQIDPASASRRIESLIDGLWLNILLYPKIYLRADARDDAFAFLAGLFPRHFPVAIQTHISDSEECPQTASRLKLRDNR